MVKKRRPKLWISIAVLVGFLTVREFGVLDWHLSRSEQTQEYALIWTDYPALRPPGWGTWVRFEDPAVHEPPIDTREDYVVTICAYVTKFEMEGLYWLPLVKRGGVTYEATILAPDGTELGTLTGSITLKVTGSSSTRHFRSRLRRSVEETIQERVNGQISDSLNDE